MSIEIILNNNVVKQSKNLRGILDYARLYAVVSCCVVSTDTENYIYFRFNNDATATVNFGSSEVAKNWLLSRRSWGKPSCIELSEYLTVYQW